MKLLFPLLIVAAVGALVFLFWRKKVLLTQRPSNYANLTREQQAAYDAALINAQFVDGSPYE